MRSSKPAEIRFWGSLSAHERWGSPDHAQPPSASLAPDNPSDPFSMSITRTHS
jgi:hypothetical protein